METNLRFTLAGIVFVIAIIFCAHKAFTLSAGKTPVVWENDYKAVATNLRNSNGSFRHMGCKNEPSHFEARKDSLIFTSPSYRAGYKTLYIDSTKSTFYGLRHDEAVVMISRLKAPYMPKGKEFEFLYINTPEATLLFNAYEECPPHNVDPKPGVIEIVN